MKLSLENDESKILFSCLPLVDQMIKKMDQKESKEYIERRLALREVIHTFVKKLKEIGEENGI